jgi:hypothetical protein
MLPGRSVLGILVEAVHEETDDVEADDDDRHIDEPTSTKPTTTMPKLEADRVIHDSSTRR